jgi:hypothetical protein
MDVSTTPRSNSGFCQSSNQRRILTRSPSVTCPIFDIASDGRLLLLERTINQVAPLAVITNWRAIMTRQHQP